ncbi:MAG: hypothetical protein H6739_22060 [Alphaproteobacteria bacterium]|nr:hypothetical protein [Alphaproteobacteria bacterium]
MKDGQLSLFNARSGGPRHSSTPPVPGLELRFRGAVPVSPERLPQARLLGRLLLAANRDADRCLLTINANRRRVLSWRRRGQKLDVSVHHRVLASPEDIVAVVMHRDASAWTRLRARFEAQGPLPPPAPRRLVSSGHVHDLMPLYDHVNDTFFEGAHGRHQGIVVGWGRWPTVPPRRSLRLGSCSGAPPVIRVHPSLDDPRVPVWFVGFVLFHELLHVEVPPRAGPSGRRLVHPPEFCEREQRHPRYEDACAWERANIDWLVRRTRAVVRDRRSD